MDSPTIRAREEISEQIKALGELKEMALKYGIDISKPATDVKEAIQWTYFGYLSAVKEQNGAAMSIGRISTFLDIYAEKDLASGKYTEKEIQEFSVNELKFRPRKKKAQAFEREGKETKESEQKEGEPKSHGKKSAE